MVQAQRFHHLEAHGERGFSDTIGSWKTMPMSPRTARISIPERAESLP